jgi:HlyD family secretion protein
MPSALARKVSISEAKQVGSGNKQPGQFPMLGIVTLVIIIVTVIAGVIWHSAAERNKIPGWQKNVIRVEKGALDVEVVTSGLILPYNEVKISPKTTGLLKHLLVVQGQRVKRGQLLALMDDSNIVGQVAAARGAVGVARAAYDKELNGNRPQEIENAKDQMYKNEHAVRSAEEDVKRAEHAVIQAQAAEIRDDTNARNYKVLGREGAVSAQDALNAVTQGQVSDELRVQAQKQLAESESALQQAKQQLASAQQQYSLEKEGFRKEDIAAAHQTYMQAQGTLNYLESLLADTKITAPFDGVITQKYTDEGAIVTPTAAAVTTSATTSSIVALAGWLELVASVAETDVEHIVSGQSVSIYANAYPDKEFHGKVYLVAPEAVVTQNVTTFQVHATISDDPQGLLMSGMNVTAHFPCKKLTNVLLLPTVCIISKRGETGVLIPDQNGNALFRAVKVGATTGTKTVIRDGVKEGEMVFISLTPEQLAQQGYSTQSPSSGTTGQTSMVRGLTR